MINKIAIFWCVICVSILSGTDEEKYRKYRDEELLSSQNEENRMLQDIQDGDIVAWSRHITGQDVNDPDTHHYFRSVAVVDDNSTRANGDTRTDSVVYAVVDRTIDDVNHTLIEQFQALDWGNDPNYCWFVDAGVGGTADVNSYGRDAIPDIPAVLPVQDRDEAYAIAGRLAIAWFDPNYTQITQEALTGSALCSTIDIDDDTGNIVAGSGPSDGGSYIYYWDADLNREDDKYTPSDNWGASTSVWQYCGAVRFSSDGSSIYAVGYSTNLYMHAYKFPTTGGAETWIYTLLGLKPYSMYVDASDNVYMFKSTGSDNGIVKVDTNGNFVSFTNMLIRLVNDIWIDEANDRYYAVGNASGSDTSICAINSDGTNKDLALGVEFYCVIKSGDYIYASGSRSANGVGGANATVYKFDTELALQASYDTGAGTAITYLIFNTDGNLVLRNNGGTTQTILDTDLNLIDTFELSPELIDIYGGEIIVIDYMDDGTALIPGTPGIEPNYVDVNDYDYFYNGEVCVYADGRPLGVFTVFQDANDTWVLDLGAQYNVVIYGINYYSIYENFPLVIGSKYGTSQGWRTSIRNARVDFYETMGCHVGVTQDASVDWKFSDDNFATSIYPVTEIKEAPFLWGPNREPVVYLWEWDPIPATIRSIDTKLEVTIE